MHALCIMKIIYYGTTHVASLYTCASGYMSFVNIFPYGPI